MAPRNPKAKKAAEVKVSENDAPKKGKGKVKTIEEIGKDLEDTVEVENENVVEKAPIEKAPVDKKKRGKKVQENGEQNGNAEVHPPAKRGRKKNAEPTVDSTVPDPVDSHIAESKEHVNGNVLVEEDIETAIAEPENDFAKQEAKDDIVEEPKSSKGQNKPKKQAKSKDVKENGDVEDKVAEKPKGKGRGKKAQPKPEADPEAELEEIVEPEKIESTISKRGRKQPAKDYSENNDEEKPEKPKKGRGKAAKVDESPEPVDDISEETEEEVKPKKAPAKGRGKAKKAASKESEDEHVNDEKEPAIKKRKVNKKTEKGQGDDNGMEDAEEIPVETKAKGKRAPKKAIEAPELDTEPEDTGEKKLGRKPAKEKAPAKEAKQKAPPKNKATTVYEDIDFSNTSKNAQGKEWNLKISNWNVDGIRAWMSKGGLDYIQHEKPDILCLQEVKCSQDKLPEECKKVPGYHAYWLCSDKDGYAGVGIYTTKLAMNVQYGLQNEELDTEGRIITAEYEQFYLICTYVPNAGRKLVTLPKRLDWNEAFRQHVKDLDKKKPVIICGDMNVAHNEIDLSNPKSNRKNAGFTEEERTGMTELLGDGFVDTYRRLYPDVTGKYTFWTYMMNSRAKNVGWRLDYFIVSERLMPTVCDNVIRDQVFGSDHCPLSLFLHLTTADKPKEE